MIINRKCDSFIWIFSYQDSQLGNRGFTIQVAFIMPCKGDSLFLLEIDEGGVIFNLFIVLNSSIRNK